MSIFPYLMSPGAILQFYNLTIMYLTQNIRKNTVNVDLEFYFYYMLIMEIVMVTLVILLSKLGIGSWWYSPLKNTHILSNFQNIVTSYVFLLLSIQNVFPYCDQFFKFVIEIFDSWKLELSISQSLVTVIKSHLYLYAIEILLR